MSLKRNTRLVWYIGIHGGSIRASNYSLKMRMLTNLQRGSVMRKLQRKMLHWIRWRSNLLQERQKKSRGRNCLSSNQMTRRRRKISMNQNFVMLPEIESAARPAFGQQPLRLSDDVALAVACLRTSALVNCGSRIRYSVQSAIITVLLDSATISLLRARQMHNQSDFIQPYGTVPENFTTYQLVRDQFCLSKLSSASTFRLLGIGSTMSELGETIKSVHSPCHCFGSTWKGLWCEPARVA